MVPIQARLLCLSFPIWFECHDINSLTGSVGGKRSLLTGVQNLKRRSFLLCNRWPTPHFSMSFECAVGPLGTYSNLLHPLSPLPGLYQLWLFLRPFFGPSNKLLLVPAFLPCSLVQFVSNSGLAPSLCMVPASWVQLSSAGAPFVGSCLPFTAGSLYLLVL